MTCRERFHAPDLSGSVLRKLGYRSMRRGRWWQRDRVAVPAMLVGIGAFVLTMVVLWGFEAAGPQPGAPVGSELGTAFHRTHQSWSGVNGTLYRVLVPSSFVAEPASSLEQREVLVQPVPAGSPLPWFGIEATPTGGPGYEEVVARAPGLST
jgi:hypothetical protein